MQTQGENLQNAISNLYAVFDRYPLRMNVDGCPHCVDQADNACIHAAPLRKLSFDNLARYAFKAMTTWGSVDDFRHFLPRILELLTIDHGWIDPETAFGKLPYGEFEKWPAEERRAVENYCRALWSVVKGTADHPFEVERCLCSIAQVIDDLVPYLNDWQPARSFGEAIQFAKFVDCVWWQGHPWSKYGGSWWKDRPAQADQVVEWIKSPDRLTELETAFYEFGKDETFSNAISEAWDHLQNLRVQMGIDCHKR